jgi:hypothetical protein
VACFAPFRLCLSIHPEATKLSILITIELFLWTYMLYIISYNMYTDTKYNNIAQHASSKDKCMKDCYLLPYRHGWNPTHDHCQRLKEASMCSTVSADHKQCFVLHQLQRNQL